MRVCFKMFIVIVALYLPGCSSVNQPISLKASGVHQEKNYVFEIVQTFDDYAGAFEVIIDGNSALTVQRKVRPVNDPNCVGKSISAICSYQANFNGMNLTVVEKPGVRYQRMFEIYFDDVFVQSVTG